MSRPLSGWLAAATVVAACGDGVEVSGTVADGLEATHVWIVGIEGRDSIDAGSFRIRGAPAGAIDLRFGSATDEAGVISLTEVPRRARIRLEAIRPGGDGVRLVPSLAEVRGAGRVTVNGVRMGRPPISIGDTVDVRGQVLGTAPAIRRVLIRTEVEDWPDLEVSIPADVGVTDGEGREVSPGNIRPGDEADVEIVGRDSLAYVSRSFRIDRVVEVAPPPRVVPPPTRPRILGEPAPRSRAAPPGRGRGLGRGRGRGPP